MDQFWENETNCNNFLNLIDHMEIKTNHILTNPLIKEPTLMENKFDLLVNLVFMDSPASCLLCIISIDNLMG